MKGSIEQTGIAALLRLIVREQATGVLRFARGSITKTIYLSSGQLIFATSTDPDDRLGEMLLRKGLISYRALEESVKAIRAGKRQGTILVERGEIKSRDLVSGVLEQVQEIIYGLFSWEGGEYEFVEGDLPSREVIVLRMSTADLVMEGVRRLQRWGRIRAGVGGLEQRYALSADYAAPVAAMALHKDELGLVASLDGVMTVEQICAASSQSDFLVCRALWGLWAAGVVDRVPQDREGEGGPSETMPHAGVRGASVGLEIDRFNALHRFVFEVVGFSLREGASGFFARAFARVSSEHGPLFDGVAVDAGGELDGLALRSNIARHGIARYLQGLDRLLEIEVELVREDLGEKKAEIVRAGLSALRAQAPGEGSAG